MYMKRRIPLILFSLFLGGSVMIVANEWSLEQVSNFNSTGYHKLNAAGASAGNTGAPGENNCAGCHSGGGNPIQDGGTANNLDWGTDAVYTPGNTYSVTLTFNEGSAKNGFQLTALKNSDNTKAGDIIVTDDTKTKTLSSFSGRQYLSHKSAGTGVNEWSFEWTAPATDEGPVTFYVATNKTNANGQNSGDAIYLSQFTFNSPGSSAFIPEYEKIASSLAINYNAAKAQIEIQFTAEEQEEVYASVHSVNGQEIYAEKLGYTYPGENQRSFSLRSNNDEILIVQIFIGNKVFSKKLFVNN